MQTIEVLNEFIYLFILSMCVLLLLFFSYVRLFIPTVSTYTL